MDADRNFDDIACHFEQKVYGGLKGQIRLAVLQKDIKALLPSLGGRRVLDIGAGLGQMSGWLATLGYECTLNDISKVMLSKARQTYPTLQTVHAPYQDLPRLCTPFDFIMCHALLEWVQHPQKLFAVIDTLLKPGGVLSLCFYNPVAPIYRNLLLGNFYHVSQPKPANGGLTPNNAKSYDTVMDYLKGYNYTLIGRSGVRVFYDYASKKQGGLLSPSDVIAMELAFSGQAPYWQMGRYIHLLLQKPPQ